MEIDADLLITLVECRPVLWDKTNENYRDRNLTKESWREIFMELNTNFEKYDAVGKNNFGKAVIKRWVNIRDAFNKSLKKEKEKKRSGSGASVTTKYVYAEQLKFLTKIFTPRLTDDSLSATSSTDSETEVIHDDSQGSTHYRQKQFKTPLPRKELGCRKRKKNDGESRLIQVSEKPEDRHISFFKGIVPTLHTFTEDETIQFQMGVLQLISNIRQIRNQSQQIVVNTDSCHFQPLAGTSADIYPQNNGHMTETTVKPKVSGIEERTVKCESDSHVGFHC